MAAILCQPQNVKIICTLFPSVSYISGMAKRWGLEWAIDVWMIDHGINWIYPKSSLLTYRWHASAVFVW